MQLYPMQNLKRIDNKTIKKQHLIIIFFHGIIFCSFLQEFLKKEFSEENIVFWSTCEKFKKITDANEVRKKAVEMEEVQERRI